MVLRARKDEEGGIVLRSKDRIERTETRIREVSAIGLISKTRKDFNFRPLSMRFDCTGMCVTAVTEILRHGYSRLQQQEHGGCGENLVRC